MSITESLFFSVRHPERSGAIDFLFSEHPYPSVVEGPCRFDSEMTATDSALSMHGHSRRPSITTPSVTHNAAFMPHRSFDFGSVGRHGKTHLPLASAQDDGALVFPLVPKLHLGTHLAVKLCFATGATKLRGQGRSQVQLGNEEHGDNP